MGRPNYILFDLDGTLLDTAPDLANALNVTRQEYDLPALAYAAIREVVSDGSIAMTRLGSPFEECSVDFQAFRNRLLVHYEANVAEQSALFAGMETVLRYIEANGLTWGVVTNKPAYLTTPLLAKLRLDIRAAVVVSGDTVAYSKPHPAPLQFAARQISAKTQQCVYIGDARRDIEAGRAAGMRCLAAAYGYVIPGDPPDDWGADAIVESPISILDWLEAQDCASK